MIITTAIDKIEALQKRIKIIQGGTSAGKTYSVLAVLITKAASYARTEISIVAESIPHLRRGALKDFLKIMKENNRYFDERFNKSLLRYEFSNGSVMEFFSADATCPTVIGVGMEPRIAFSSSIVADVIASNPSATIVSSSVPLSARTVTRLPAAVLIVMLIGASE